MTMLRDEFYQSLVSAAQQPPQKRRLTLTDLHMEAINTYLETIRRITPQGAMRVVRDSRTVAQVVAHIAEWDRAVILAVGEVLAGVAWPRLMSQTVTVEPDGNVRSFASVDEFNAYYALEYAGQSWEDIQGVALDMATMLHQLFVHPGIVTLEQLEGTRRYDYRLPTGVTLTIPCGWYLWMVTLEHEMVEHAADLMLGRET
jgi:hypothetical protein